MHAKPFSLAVATILLCVGCGSVVPTPASPPSRQTQLLTTAEAFDRLVLAGSFAAAYKYLDDRVKKECAPADFGPFANLWYAFASGTTLQVRSPEVTGDKGIVKESLLRGGVPISRTTGAFFTSGIWYWHWTGSAWTLDNDRQNPCLSSTASLPPPSPMPMIPSATASAPSSVVVPTVIPTSSAVPATPRQTISVPTPRVAMQTPGPIPAGWCGVRIKDGDTVLVLQDAATFCANYWVQNNHLAVGGNWEVTVQVPLDDSVVCTGRLGNAGTPFEVWDTGDQHWGHLLCQAYQQQ